MNLLIALVLCIQNPKPPLVNQKDVDEAIKKGADFLLQKVKDGLGMPSINADKGLSYEGIVLYTLVHAGVDVKDVTMQRLIETVKNQKVNRTYTAAMNACALMMVDPNKYREQLALIAQYLVDNQALNGQWGYGEAYDIPMPTLPVASGQGDTPAPAKVKFNVKRSKKIAAPQVGDNSNSQYAALGLWACSKAGAEYEQEVLDRAIKWWEGSQQPDGGWGYCWDGKHDEKMGTFGSMTAGGAGSLVILRKLRGHDPKSGPARKGIQWIADHWTVAKNPGAPQDREIWHYYYLYAMERLGDLFPTDKMGKYLWYAEGADFLIKNQKGGMWQSAPQALPIADTCFGILFLKRSMSVITTSAFGPKPPPKEDEDKDK